MDFNNFENSSYKSTDWDMIEKHKIDSNIKVHIENLKNPDTSRQIRALDESHVECLKLAFHESFQSGFTILAGMVIKKPDCKEDYALPGKACVEVLGGNHTRVALQSMQTVDHVYMELYEGLTDVQALKIGMEHNKMHEYAKKMTFEETVTLFRNVFVMTQRKHLGKTDRQISLKWRANLCGITGKSKKQLKNVYKIHLQLAVLEAEEWHALLEVFESFRQKKIKGQQSHDQATQYVFVFFNRVQTSEETKRNLLVELASGKMTVPQFRTECKKLADEKKKSLETNYQSDESSRSVDANDDEESWEPLPKHKLSQTKQLERENKEADIKCITKLFTREKELRKIALSTIEGKEKQLKEKNKRIVELEEREKETRQTYEEKISTKNKQIEKYKHHIQELNVKRESLQKDIAREKLRRAEAEEAASRARQSYLSNINSSSESKLSLKRKSEQISEKNQKICPPKKQPNQQKAVGTEEINEDNRSSSESKLNVKRKSEQISEKNQEIFPPKKQPNQEKAAVTEEINEDNGSNVDLALVEYNNRKVYYVQLKGDTAIYCQKPVGQLKQKQFIHQPVKQSFIINVKDIQKFDEEFIISRMTGTCHGGQIMLDKMSMSVSDQLSVIISYFNT